MGSPPPPNAPTPEQQAIITADASFPPSPTAADICGFKIPPSFNFNISFNIPIPNFSLPLPFNLAFTLSLKCDLSDPFDAEVKFGGGKTPTGNQDAEFVAL